MTAPTYATITVLRFPTDEAQQAGQRALEALLNAARDVTGLRDCWVVGTGDREATVITLYADRAAADAAGDRMRQRIGSALGPQVAGPPDRRGGVVLAHGTRSRLSS